MLALELDRHVMIARGQDALDDEGALIVDGDLVAQYRHPHVGRNVAAIDRDRPAIDLDIAEGGIVVAHAGGNGVLLPVIRQNAGLARQRQRLGFVKPPLRIIGAQDIDETVIRPAIRCCRRHDPGCLAVLPDIEDRHGVHRGIAPGGKDADLLARDVTRIVVAGEEWHLLAHREGAAEIGGRHIQDGVGAEAIILHLDVRIREGGIGGLFGVLQRRGSGHMLSIHGDREHLIAAGAPAGLCRRKDRESHESRQRTGQAPVQEELHSAPSPPLVTSLVSMSSA